MRYTFRTWHIPERMMGGILRYLNDRIKPGRFLTAVIENNLSDAVGYADDENIVNLPAFVSFFYLETSSSCHGSKEKMKAWLEAGNERKQE